MSARRRFGRGSQAPPPVRAPPSAKPARTRRRGDTFNTYIYKLLRMVYDEEDESAEPLGISSKAMDIMNQFVWDMFKELALRAASLARNAKRSTITSSDIQAACMLRLPGELSRHAVQEGNSALRKFHESQ